jgi:hypothetical protein
VAALSLARGDALAGDALAGQGLPITTSDYTVDLFQGPVLASSRITALAGANAALAIGAEALSTNAAAAAVRAPHSDAKTDWDIAMGVSFPGSIFGYTIPRGAKGNDFDNNGTAGFTYDNFFVLTPAALVQEGPLGIGASVVLQQYSLGHPPGTNDTISSVRLRYVTGRLQASYAFLDHQLYAGGGLRGVLLALVENEAESPLLTMAGVGVEGGLLWAPHRVPLRLGFTARSPVSGKAATGSKVSADDRGDLKLGSMYMPSRISLPWELELGVATQIGPRPLNPPYVDPRTLPEEEVAQEVRAKEPVKTTQARILRKRYAALPRTKLLVSTALLLTGTTSNAVGFESFLSQVVDRSGEALSLTPRLGLEGELVPGWLQLRLGTYQEPTRFAQSTARLHGTFGFDQRIFSWNLFGILDEAVPLRVGGAIDVARSYFNWGVSAGVWH